MWSASTTKTESLTRVIEDLRRHYGTPPAPEPSDPFELILWDNVAYLVDDERRRATWVALRDQIGTEPDDILDVDPEHLASVIARGGMHPRGRADKLRRAAELASSDFEGDLAQVLRLPVSKAKRALRRFPGVGEPGADRILLFSRTHPILTVESNGLRVLLRLGFGEEGKSYGASYRTVRDAVAGEIPDDYDWLIEAHQLLRQHGQTLCRRSAPQCNACSLIPYCPSATAAG